MNVEALVSGHFKAQHREGIARYQKTGHGRYVDSRKLVELPAVSQDGAEIWIEMSLSPIEPTYGPRLEGRRFVLAIVRDVTERKVLEERLSYQAFHDSLTGLPNRSLFVERLEQAMTHGPEAGGTWWSFS